MRLKPKGKKSVKILVAFYFLIETITSTFSNSLIISRNAIGIHMIQLEKAIYAYSKIELKIRNRIAKNVPNVPAVAKNVLSV